MQIIPAFGPKVNRYDLLWAIWIPGLASSLKGEARSVGHAGHVAVARLPTGSGGGQDHPLQELKMF